MTTQKEGKNVVISRLTSWKVYKSVVIYRLTIHREGKVWTLAA